jgi:hypothetical protein
MSGDQTNVTFNTEHGVSFPVKFKALGDSTITIDELRGSIDILATNPTFPIIITTPLTKESDIKIYKAYQNLVLGVSLLYNTPLYNDIITYISSLPRPSNPTPGTAGAYLFGCLFGPGGLNPGCSFVCANGILPPPPLNIADTKCKAQVWSYLKTGYTVINSGNSPSLAYILVKNNFRGFTQVEINDFASKFTDVQLYRLNNGNYVSYGEVMNVNELPLVTNNNTTLWLGGILVVLLVVAFIALFYRYHYGTL